ncbi:MAG: hypothetical protein QG608_3547, partial [Actinomycetota bacterium]|nr:hypothetical protein [Actinomycetota bacterium]
PGGRTLLASGSADGTVRLHQLFWEPSTERSSPYALTLRSRQLDRVCEPP